MCAQPLPGRSWGSEVQDADTPMLPPAQDLTSLGILVSTENPNPAQCALTSEGTGAVRVGSV